MGDMCYTITSADDDFALEKQSLNICEVAWQDLVASVKAQDARPGFRTDPRPICVAWRASTPERRLRTLVNIMTDPESPAAARVSASKEIIERGFGKAGNIVSLNLETPLADLQPKDALAIVSDKVIKGELPVDDGTKLTSMIEARMRAVEVAELEQRLKALETQ
jgi:hypothetical protein